MSKFAGYRSINHYVKTYHLLLNSGNEVSVSSLEDLHKEVEPILHLKAKTEFFDEGAFKYSYYRLPEIIYKVKNVVFGQSDVVFKKAGYKNIDNWENVTSSARRRKMLFNGVDTLACFVTSASDIDDMVTILVAYQIEWNKLNSTDKSQQLEIFNQLSKSFKNFDDVILNLKKRKLDIKLRLLASSMVDYTKAIQRWWKHISSSLKPSLNVNHVPVYIISSNLHSLTNIVSPFVSSIEKSVLKYVSTNDELKKLQSEVSSLKDLGKYRDFLYYASKKYLASLSSKELKVLLSKRDKIESGIGIKNVWANHYLDINAQVLPISKIDFKNIDPRIKINQENINKLKKSNAVIINYDYPLGFGAYGLIQEILENAKEVRGLYVLGKAATLVGETGDIMIPDVVFDAHSGNIYFFDNCFNSKSLKPYIKESIIFDKQKSASVKGTYLQNKDLIDSYVDNGISIVEMEGGPYLSALYETSNPNRYPVGQSIKLDNVPFDFGMINYASDTHYLRGKNLGANLSYKGVTPVYVSTIAILNRIFDLESKNIF